MGISTHVTFNYSYFLALGLLIMELQNLRSKRLALGFV